MKNHFKNFCFLTLLINLSCVFGQDVIEILIPKLSEENRQQIDHIFSMTYEGLDTKQLHQAIDTLETIRQNSNTFYERYITSFHLTFFYSQNNNYEKCLDLLKRGQEQDFFFPQITGKFTWPEYLPKLKKLDDFSAWSLENKHRLDLAKRQAKAEYFIQTPAGYQKDKSYPLLIVFHGGIDSNISSYLKWQSSHLQSKIIVAYFQGKQVQGSYHRSYSGQWQSAVKQAYQQIIEKYSVDTNRILAGGASAGAMKVFEIVQEQIIPLSGAILAFPGPCKYDEPKLKQLAEDGVRVVLLTGEHDGALKYQKELSFIFDKAELPNRFVIFPEIGHQFPKDFSDQIDLSLNFIWNE